MAVPPESTTLAYNLFAGINVTLHDVPERSVVDYGIRLEHHHRTTETFGTDSGVVYV